MSKGSHKRTILDEVEQCMNPVFARCLYDLKLESEAKGSKLAFTYHKALRGIIAYPAPLSNGSQAAQIPGIGAKICRLLDEALMKATGTAATATNVVPHPPQKVAKPRKMSPQTVSAPASTSTAVRTSTTPAAGTLPTTTLPTTTTTTTTSSLSNASLQGKSTSVSAPSLSQRAAPSKLKSWSEIGHDLISVFPYEYVGEAGVPVSSQRLAASLVEDDALMFHVQCHRDNQDAVDLLFQAVPYGLYMRGYIYEDIAVCSVSGTNVQGLAVKKRQLDQTVQDAAAPSSAPKRVALVRRPVEDQDEATDVDSDAEPVATAPQHATALPTSSLASTVPTNLQRTMQRVASDTASNAANSVTYMEPGTFDVILVADSREVLGPGDSGAVLMEELVRMRVPVDRRSLGVGDFIWIARDKQNPHREFVLDYVVERKRMDDLTRSIISKHFSEQKFRLAGSGLSHVICIIEDYGHMSQHSLPASSILQDMANSQIHRGYFVKHTTSMKDTAAYLCLLTRHLVAKYSQSRLVSQELCRSSMDNEDLFWTRTLERPMDGRLLAFPDFQWRTQKKKDLNVREMFAMHLMCLRGVTPEKADAITTQFPTVQHLVKALSLMTDRDAQINSIANIRFGRIGQHRTIGWALGSRISKMYTRAVLPTEKFVTVTPPVKRTKSAL